MNVTYVRYDVTFVSPYTENGNVLTKLGSLYYKLSTFKVHGLV